MRLEESADGGVMRLGGGAELMELGRVVLGKWVMRLGRS